MECNYCNTPIGGLVRRGIDGEPYCATCYDVQLNGWPTLSKQRPDGSLRVEESSNSDAWVQSDHIVEARQ